MDKKSPKYPTLAHPRLTVEVGTETFQVEAKVTEEPERTRHLTTWLKSTLVSMTIGAEQRA